MTRLSKVSFLAVALGAGLTLLYPQLREHIINLDPETKWPQ